MGNQLPEHSDLGDRSPHIYGHAANDPLVIAIPTAFGSVWTSIRRAQQLLRTDGQLRADAEEVNRELLAQVLERIGPDYASGLLRLLGQWCASDLRDDPAVTYLHSVRSIWARELTPILSEPRGTGSSFASVSFGSVLHYDDLARLVAAGEARQLSEDLEQLASRGPAAPCFVEEPSPDEVLWVTGLSTGLRTLDVAIKYGVSERTLYRKLGECRLRYEVDSNRELFTVFARNGWLDHP